MFDKYDELLEKTEDPATREMLLALVEEHSLALTALHYLSSPISALGAFLPSDTPKHPTIERCNGGILVTPEAS